MPPRSLENLNKDADMIVVGTVTHSSPVKHDEMQIITTMLVKIESIEKGEAAASLGTLNIRCHALNPKAKLKGSSGFNGNRYVGTKCRFWLKKQKDGQWVPLPPNGIEILEEKIEADKKDAVAAPQTIETLWVSDQLTGMMALWERKQQRWLITPTKIYFQSMALQINEEATLEAYSDEASILNQWKNQHGGVIEMGPAKGAWHSVTRGVDESTELPAAPEHTSETFAEEEGIAHLAYRWLEGGRADFVLVVPEDKPNASPVDVPELLETLADPEAFSALKSVGENTLLPETSAFSNFAEMKGFEKTLKDFKKEDPDSYKAVSAALDKRWKTVSAADVPKRLQGIGLFTDAYLFGLIHHDAMIDAGYNPYIGSFDFAVKQTEKGLGIEPGDEDPELIEMQKVLQTRFDPYSKLFEESLREILKNPTSPMALPQFEKEDLTGLAQ